MALQRLAGASLLVFANKQDLPGSMTQSEISDVRLYSYTFEPFARRLLRSSLSSKRPCPTGSESVLDQIAPLDDLVLQCCHRAKSGLRLGPGSERRCGKTLLQLYRGKLLLQHPSGTPQSRTDFMNERSPFNPSQHFRPKHYIAAPLVSRLHVLQLFSTPIHSSYGPASNGRFTP
jgi:hypothetical protein